MVPRYINHSCAPNCVAEVVTFERGHKIIISCVRRIAKGEEVGIFWLHWGNIFGRVQPWIVSSLLTVFQLCFYYQLECVEGQHKTACHCGAPECRKWINWGKEWQKKNDKSKHIPCRDVCSHPSLHRGKKASHLSHFTNKQKPKPREMNGFTRTFIRTEPGNVTRMWLVPYMGGSAMRRFCQYVCICVFDVHEVRKPPANGKALCRVRPYCLLRAGPFVSYC